MSYQRYFAVVSSDDLLPIRSYIFELMSCVPVFSSYISCTPMSAAAQNFIPYPYLLSFLISLKICNKVLQLFRNTYPCHPKTITASHFSLGKLTILSPLPPFFYSQLFPFFVGGWRWGRQLVFFFWYILFCRPWPASFFSLKKLCMLACDP